MIIIPKYFSKEILFTLAKNITHTHTHRHTHSDFFHQLGIATVAFRETNECLVYPLSLQIFSTMDYFNSHLSNDSI